MVTDVHAVSDPGAIGARLDAYARAMRTRVEFQRLLRASLGRDEFLREACRLAVDPCGFRMAWVGSVSGESPFVVPVASAGRGEEYAGEIRVRQDETLEGRGPTGRAVREGRTVALEDTETDPQFAPWRDTARRYGFRSSAAAPIRVGDAVFGTLNLYASEPGAFSGEVLAIVQALADDVGDGLCRIEERRRVTEAETARRASERRAECELRESEARFIQAQKLEAVGRLAGGVAHDFNNLLTVILGYGQMVLDSLGPEHPVASRLGEMVRAAERASGLTRQLLAFSRRQVMQPRVLDVNQVVRNLEKMLVRLLGEDVRVESRLAPGLLTVRVDEGQFEQVLVNLAVNARDAMPDGGTLTISTREVEIGPDAPSRDEGVAPGRCVLVEVADTGIGMDATTQARLFEPFFTTKPCGQGTGLGLATVWGIVRQSGGHVDFTSEPGRGTSFRVHLPRVEADAEARDVSPLDPTRWRGTETVLVVEDQEGVRGVARSMLESAGYRVLDAGDAATARARLAAHPGPVDLLLADVVLPDESGPGLAERLATLRPGMRVLFVSGYLNDDVVRHGAPSASGRLLDKPFTRERLLRAVRQALDDPLPERGPAPAAP